MDPDLKALIEEARQLGSHKTAKGALIAALVEYVHWRKQMQIIDHFGTIDFDPEYDPGECRRLDRIPE